MIRPGSLSEHTAPMAQPAERYSMLNVVLEGNSSEIASEADDSSDVDDGHEEDEMVARYTMMFASAPKQFLDIGYDEDPELPFRNAISEAETSPSARTAGRSQSIGPGSASPGPKTRNLSLRNLSIRFNRTQSTPGNGEGGKKSSVTAAVMKKWSQRLKDVNSLAGKLESSETGGEYTFKECWPSWLPDAAFEVVKINEMGRHQKRVLRLTERHIENIKRRTEVSKQHAYDEVSNVLLVQADQLVIFFHSAPELRYVSPIAAAIVQQISLRMSTRFALDKKVKTVGYSPAATAMMINTYAWQNSVSMNDDAQGDSTYSRAARTSSTRLRKARAEKLIKMTGDTEQQRLQLAIQAIIYDKLSPEGRTREHFIKTFNPAQQGTAAVRQFVDGMHDYMRTHRSAELSHLLVQGPVHVDLSASSPEVIASLSYILLHAIEESVFSALRNQILPCLPASQQRQEEAMLMAKIRILAKKDQSFFHIPSEFQSRRNWQTAIDDLKAMEHCNIPSEKLQALLTASRSIYWEFNAIVRPDLPDPDGTLLTADDFFPIFTFVFARAELTEPMLIRDMLWALCHPDQLHGESGYYLTIFEAAIEYASNVEVDEVIPPVAPLKSISSRKFSFARR